MSCDKPKEKFLQGVGHVVVTAPGTYRVTTEVDRAGGGKKTKSEN